MRRLYTGFYGLLVLVALACSSCGSPTTMTQSVPETKDPTINPNFQEMPKAPTPPPYECGSWSSNTAPSANGTITVYAKITKNVVGVGGASASATVHFQDGDEVFDPQASDQNGMATFVLPLRGRQPTGVPATVDVMFAVGDAKVKCGQAFFTPQ